MYKIPKYNNMQDLKFLYELDKNSRASFASVGRFAHISAQESKRKYDSLKQAGILKYCFPIIDNQKLGYFTITYLLKLHNLTKDSEDEFFRYLNSTNAVTKIMRGDGHFDVGISITATSMVVAERVFQDINSRFSHFIMSYETVLPTASYKFPRNYLANKTELVQYNLFSEEEHLPIKLKEDALRVLEAINFDARANLRDIAIQIKMSYDKVKNNLKKLEATKIIKDYTYLLDHEKLEFPCFRVHLELHYLSRPREQALFDYCNFNPNIINYVRLLGAWQLALDIEIKNREGLRELLREMKSRFADMIIRVETTELYQIDRYRDVPLELTLPAPIV